MSLRPHVPGLGVLSTIHVIEYTLTAAAASIYVNMAGRLFTVFVVVHGQLPSRTWPLVLHREHADELNHKASKSSFEMADMLENVMGEKVTSPHSHYLPELPPHWPQEQHAFPALG